MVSAGRWWVALLTVALLLAGGAAAWLYFDRPAPRVPARARQVLATEPDGGFVAPYGTENSQGIKQQIVRTLSNGSTKQNNKEAE